MLKSMKLFPARGKFHLLFVLCLLLLGVIGFFRVDRVPRYVLSGKQEGDILFQSLPHGDLVNSIEGVSQSEWSHCGILVKQEGEWMVAESIQDVRHTPLAQWVLRGRGCKVHTYRVKDLPENHPDYRTKLAAGISEHLGKPYDINYAPGDDLIYCSELVYKVYDRELGIQIGDWQKLGDLNWEPHQEYIKELEGSLPLDREMITPVQLTRSPLVERVH